MEFFFCYLRGQSAFIALWLINKNYRIKTCTFWFGLVWSKPLFGFCWLKIRNWETGDSFSGCGPIVICIKCRSPGMCAHLGLIKLRSCGMTSSAFLKSGKSSVLPDTFFSILFSPWSEVPLVALALHVWGILISDASPLFHFPTLDLYL